MQNTKKSPGKEMITVKNIKIEDITPEFPEGYEYLLPKDPLRQQKCEFELHNVNGGVSSAIRSVLLDLPTFGLDIELTNEYFECTDKYIKVEFVQLMLRCVQIMQNIDESAVFSLYVMNDTPHNIYVTTADLKQQKGEKPKHKLFDENVIICDLAPGKYISVKNIFVRQGRGSDHGGFAMAYASVSIPLGIEMYNMYTKKGESTSTARPRSFKIIFETNGTETLQKIIELACDELVMRLRDIEKHLESINKVGNLNKLSIDREDDTIGNILYEYICEIYPGISHCNIGADMILNKLDIVVVAPNASEILLTAAQNAASDVEKIKKILSKELSGK